MRCKRGEGYFFEEVAKTRNAGEFCASTNREHSKSMMATRRCYYLYSSLDNETVEANFLKYSFAKL